MSASRPPTEASAAQAAARVVALGLDGSLGEAPADLLIQTAFAAELGAQARLGGDLSLADLAHTLMLLEAGVVPAEAGRRVLAALLRLHDEPSRLVPDPRVGDLYTNREAWLLANEPAAGWLGAGRARREATTTAHQLLARRQVVGLARSLVRFGLALVDRAEAERATLMPDLTYLQVAQPTTFGHYLLGFVGPVRRDLERTAGLFGRVDRSPAGAGSGNGSLLAQDRERLAELLGFDGLVIHGRDAVWQADLAIEAGALAVAAAVTMDRLAEDLLIFASTPFGFVAVGDEHARASRALPQKRNPFALTHLRAVANRTIGGFTSIATASRMPTGQPDTRSVAGEASAEALAVVTGAVDLAAAVVRGLSVDAERCFAVLADSDAAASDLVAVLVRDGRGALDVRTAHRVVARLIRARREARRSLTTASAADVVTVAVQSGVDVATSEEAIRTALDPDLAVEGRGQTGGAGSGPMAAMIEDDRSALAQASAHWDRVAARLAAAEAALLARARATADGGGT